MRCGQMSLRNAALSLPFWKLTKYISVIKALRSPVEQKDTGGPLFNPALSMKCAHDKY